MDLRTKVLKVLVFIIVLLLSTTLLAQVNPQFSYYKVKPGELSWLRKKNFDVQYYDGSDSLINQYLTEALTHRRNGNLIKAGGAVMTFIVLPVGILGVAYGGQQYAEGVEYLNLATIRRNDFLLGGRTFTGSEDFRKEDQTNFFKRQNFHVDHYDGQSQELNILLNEAYRFRNKARNQSKIGIGANVGGLGMMLLGLFSFAFGEADSVEPWVTAGALVHFSSHGFFISAFSKRQKSRRMVNQVSRTWYQRLNQNRSNPVQHLSDQ